MVFYDIFPKPKEWINAKTNERWMILPDSEELDEVEINHHDLVEVDLEEQDFIDEVNLFDYVSLGFAALCLYLNLNSYFSTLEIRFTSLS